MNKAEEVYQQLVVALTDGRRIAAGNLFGKPCLKVAGKAFVAQHRDAVVFKLPSPHREEALAFDGAALWDPSGKGKPMKEWIAVPGSAEARFPDLAVAALEFVGGAS